MKTENINKQETDMANTSGKYTSDADLKLNTNEVKDFVIDAFMIKRVPYLSGDRGIGKSDIIGQIAKEKKLKLIDLRLSQMLPEDLMGIPKVDTETGKAKYIPFDTIPLEGDTVPEGYKGWLLMLDELSSASEEVMAACYKLILDRKVSNTNVHPKVFIAAAGNRSTDSAIANRLPETLVNRMMVCTVIPDTDSWIEWAKKSNIHPDIIRFIENDPEQLNTADGGKFNQVELNVIPTPRSWETASRIAFLMEKQGHELSSGHTVNRLMSTIGASSAIAFGQFMLNNVYSVNINEILADPENTAVPSETNILTDMVTAISRQYPKLDPEDRVKVDTYIARLPEEFQQMFIDSIMDLIHGPGQRT